jgi:hypothetical protein
MRLAPGLLFISEGPSCQRGAAPVRAAPALRSVTFFRREKVYNHDGEVHLLKNRRWLILAAAALLAGLLSPDLRFAQEKEDQASALQDDSEARAAKRKVPPSPKSPPGYRGVLLADVNPANSFKDEVVADFGSLGLWVYEQMTWNQILGIDPDWVMAVELEGAPKAVLIADLGAKGLWKWTHNGYPGDWTQISGREAEWAIALDDDGDKRQELHVVFGTPPGVWRYEERKGGASSWKQISPFNPCSGLRTATRPSGPEEGGYLFPGSGVWTISLAGDEIQSRQLSGTETCADDNASARFLAGDAEDLIIDFGAKGLWLCENTRLAWHELSNRSADRVLPVRLGRGVQRLVIDFNGDSGLYYWTFDGFPGTMTKLHSADPDAGFCEAFERDGSDRQNGSQQLAVDFGKSGLWSYDHGRRTWSLVNTKNPVFMAAGDYWGLGFDSTLAVSFGADGLWLCEAKGGGWYQISNNAPDCGL